ncbi:MAG: hypothetical protein ACI9VT_000742 [Psychroserpens sp.]|jgi:hypothetical protein
MHINHIYMIYSSEICIMSLNIVSSARDEPFEQTIQFHSAINIVIIVAINKAPIIYLSF